MLIFTHISPPPKKKKKLVINSKEVGCSRDPVSAVRPTSALGQRGASAAGAEEDGRVGCSNSRREAWRENNRTQMCIRTVVPFLERSTCFPFMFVKQIWD